VKYLELAAERATARRAYHEAERHYREAIEILRTFPESPERLRHQLSLLLALGNTMGATRGITSAETTEVYARARSLAEQAGTSDSIPLLWGLASSAIAKGELQTALALSRELLEISRRSFSSPGQFLARTLYGSACHFLGMLIDARNHFLEASKHYSDEDLRGFPFTPPITRVWMKAATEWHLGYPTRALHCVDEMLALARHLNDPISLCMAYFSAGRIYQLTGDWPRMLQASEQSLGISAASRYSLLSAVAKTNLAYSCARIGRTNGAAEAIREALSELNALKWYATRRMMLGWLAEVHLLTGDIAEATASLEEALEFNVEELLFQPELLRLRGELCLRGGFGRAAMFEMAKQDFRAAIDAARAMSAKSDELRATTSLARLLARLGRRDEARMMLAEIYNWFTEGFDTADLREARLLLDDLNQ
jgi:tetratricopeptide (TPR) repeat protein